MPFDHSALLNDRSPGKDSSPLPKEAANLYKNPLCDYTFSVLSLADSRDSVGDKAVSFQTERECFWSGSSETRVNTNTHQHITDSITEKQSLLHNSPDFFGCDVDFACSGMSIGLSVFL